MKTLAKTLFAAALTAVVLTSSAMATLATEPVTTDIKTSSIKTFDRIWVSGNVKIVLTQGDKQSVEGGENFNPAKTSVYSNGKILVVNSTETGEVTLNVTVKNLERIEAYGQSQVITTNNLDVKYLQLFLQHSATARIKTTTASLYSVVNDDAVLKLNGTADQSTIIASNQKNLKLNNFASQRSASYASEAIMAAEQNAMNLAK